MGLETEEDIITKDEIEVYRTIFPELTLDDIERILSLTIKRDKVIKLITFLGMLTAYTDKSQLNISFIAPASTGKSHIALEVAKLFPQEDIKKYAYASPTAFFHTGEYDKETNSIKHDLERKILIFLDQPHSELLAKLRPLLSHDEKELIFKITDKNKKGQNKTKTIILKGFPVVIFCSSNSFIDEQETSRVILLSPEMNEEKYEEVIMQQIEMHSNKNLEQEIENNTERELLKKRIKVIKNLKFEGIEIKDFDLIYQYYSDKKNNQGLLSTDMRNSYKIFSIITGLTLLNFPHREIKGKYLIANPKDIEIGLNLWKEVEKYQNFGIPPFIYWYYEQVVIPVYKKKMKENPELKGIKKKDLISYQVKGGAQKLISEKRLRIEILPTLINSGLIREEKDPEDKREKIYFPVEGVKNE